MQPYIFPYIGYFQLFKICDIFVSYDDVQYMKGGWINRNRIFSDSIPKYITLPIRKAPLKTQIDQIFFHDSLKKEIEKILSILYRAYSRAPFFQIVYPIIEDIFKVNKVNVARFAENSIRVILDYLGMNNEIKCSSNINFDKSLKGQKRVIEIVKKLGGNRYVNPIGGRNLYSSVEFTANDIDLRFLECHAQPYRQFSNEFVPNLSIIDVLMFNSIEKTSLMLNQFNLIPANQ